MSTPYDSVLRLYRSEGELLDYNDNYGDSPPSRVFREASRSGNYYVEVGSWDDDTGSYTMTISAG